VLLAKGGADVARVLAGVSEKDGPLRDQLRPGRDPLRLAEKHAITFPLLSDQGRHVIRQLGRLNERVQEDHAHYGIARTRGMSACRIRACSCSMSVVVITQKRFLDPPLTAELHEGRDPVPEQLGDREGRVELPQLRVRRVVGARVARVAPDPLPLARYADLQERLAEVVGPPRIGDERSWNAFFIWS